MTEDPIEVHVLDRKVRLLQPQAGFRTGLDSVMVAAACPVRPGQSLLDLGCGVGGAGLCVLWRVPDVTLHGIDVQDSYLDLARKNADLNEMANRCEFFLKDVRDVQEDIRFDHIVCNPPYLEAGEYTPAESVGRAKALGHDAEGPELSDWIDAAFRGLVSGGSLTLIHRADRIDRILRLLRNRFGGTEILPLWPRAGEDAKRVIVRTRKDRRSPARIRPGLVLHESDGSYTPAAEKILRDGAFFEGR